MKGILLFAHGASDPQWVEPFRRIQAEVLVAAPALPVALAFLERSSPDFAGGVRELITRGCNEVVVFPLFLARGGHLKQDLPELIARARIEHSGLLIRQTPALGEVPEMLQAIAGFILREVDRDPSSGNTP
ncbi:MAG: cobalamin biosynthesis protein CbiX [Burkholderiales bacterium]|nr:MAG: cobalamin biosynthesis protein CbiX [Burkholderiales bacterium]